MSTERTKTSPQTVVGAVIDLVDENANKNASQLQKVFDLTSKTTKETYEWMRFVFQRWSVFHCLSLLFYGSQVVKAGCVKRTVRGCGKPGAKSPCQHD